MLPVSNPKEVASEVLADRWTLHVTGPDPDGDWYAEIKKNGQSMTFKGANSREQAIERGKAWRDYYRDSAEEVIEL